VRFHVITNVDNGKGLQRELEILADRLRADGHEVEGIHFQSRVAPPRAEVALFLETYEPRLAAGAAERWWIPNPEWATPDQVRQLDGIDRILCKTRDGLARFAELSDRVSYLGFTSRDRFDPAVERTRRFLHVPGESDRRGTGVLLEAWRRFRIPYRLTIVSWLRWPSPPPGVTILPRIDDAELRELQNACLFHLCPSEYEGFGHVIHEGLSVGAGVAVTDAPPLSEVAGVAARIPATPGAPLNLALPHRVDALGVRDVVERLVALPAADIDRIRRSARRAWLEERERFAARLSAVVAGRPMPEEPGRAVREVLTAAVPVLRGRIGGVLVFGPEAVPIAAGIVAECGLAARAATVDELGALPDDHACAAVMTEPLSPGAVRHLQRVVMAAGPLLFRSPEGFEVRSSRADRSSSAR